MSSLEQRTAEIDIRLHRKQGVALESVATEILYGGAVAGGKSFLMRAAAINWCGSIPGLQVYLFRRLRDDLVKNHIEGPKGLRMLLQPWVRAGLVDIVEDEIRFWNGSKIYLCHCKDEKDRFKYLGAEIHVLLIDELTTFTETIYRFLRSRVRMVGLTLPDTFRGNFPRILCGSNPGNTGHSWVKAAFIDARAPLEVDRMPDEEGGMLRQYIPARLEDNPSMAEDDPTYASKVSGLGSPELVKAMRDGDWNVVAGAYFPEFSTEEHVIVPRTLPLYWQKFRSFDWGSARPFSVGWWAVSDGELAEFPRGALIRYREWYGVKRDSVGRPVSNTGLRMTAEQVAEGIIEREKGDIPENKTMGGVADPAIFAEDGGPSLADRMAARKCFWRPADNTRVGRIGASGGWDQVRARLIGDGERPALYVFSTCIDFIRTFPALQHDEGRIEDIDCWVAGTMIDTPDGQRPIEAIRPGDLVNTPIGPRPVLRSYLSGTSEIVRVTLTDGTVLEGTPRHKIYVRNYGLVPLQDLNCHMIPQQRIIWSRLLNMVVSSIGDMKRAGITTHRALCSQTKLARAFIGRCGLMPEAQFLPAMTFTTAITASTITPSTTSSASRMASTPGYITWNASMVTLDRRSRIGVSQIVDERSFATMRERWSSERLSGNARALIVGFLLLRDTLARGFVPKSARKNSINPLSWFARFAGRHLPLSVIPQNRFKPVHISVVGRSAVKKAVYNLTVADAHLFYANGVLSSNTDSEDHLGDEVRYACASRPYTAPVPVNDEDSRDAYARSWKPGRARKRGSAMAA